MPRVWRVVRSAPWRPVATTTAAAVVLWAVAVVAHRTPVGLLAALMALAAAGAAAAYALDEEATDVADATPTPRGNRVRWRTLVLAVPGAVAAVGLLVLAASDDRTHWLRLLPLAAGALAVGLGFAALLRGRGLAAPGDLASVLAFCGILGAVAIDPLRRWVSLVPLGDPAQVPRSTAAWVVIALAGAVATARCATDPASRHHRLTNHQS